MADANTNESAKLAQQLRAKYNLTYACSVNLEGTIHNLWGHMPLQRIEEILTDILDNLEYVDEDEDERNIN